MPHTLPAKIDEIKFELILLRRAAKQCKTQFFDKGQLVINHIFEIVLD